MNLFEFRPLREKDLELMHQWFQEPTIKQSYARGQHFTYENIQNKYLPRIVGQENVPSFIVYQNNNPIGFIQYYPVSNHLPEVTVTGELLSLKNPLFNTYHPNEIAGIDCFIAESNDRGKGKGEQMISAFITEFLKDYRAVIVDPVQDNHPAIRCYEKAGFERTDFSENKKFIILLKTIAPQAEKPISTHNAQHFTWGDACDGWWLKKEGPFTVVSEIMPPNTAEKKHYHQFTEQFFYCLKGQLLIQLNDNEIILSAHDGFSIPPDKAHKVINNSNTATHFLVISSPDSHDDRVDLE